MNLLKRLGCDRLYLDIWCGFVASTGQMIEDIIACLGNVWFGLWSFRRRRVLSDDGMMGMIASL